jgi:hypothetical protein
VQFGVGQVDPLVGAELVAIDPRLRDLNANFTGVNLTDDAANPTVIEPDAMPGPQAGKHFGQRAGNTAGGTTLPCLFRTAG